PRFLLALRAEWNSNFHAEPAAARKAGAMSVPALTKALRLAVPAEIRLRICEAAVRGRHDDLLDLVRQVSWTEPAAGAMLGELATKFDYETLIKACG
ncbi:MAG: hypothetical protein WCL50_03020, partial [Spirochaetota bacterium]